MSHYDTEYKKNPGLFGTEPSSLVVSHGLLIPAAGKVLDVGVGQGRNAIALARRGCQVTGIDPSEVAIATTAKNAQEAEVSLDLWNGSIWQYKAEPAEFNAVLLFGLIQILTREHITDLVAWIEQTLAPAGLVFLTAWHVDDPRYAAIEEAWDEVGKNSFKGKDDEVRTYLDRGEILTLFQGWDVIHHWEGLGGEHRHGDSPPERHGRIEFVARKPTG